MKKIFIKNNDYREVESIVKNRINYDEKIVSHVRKIVADVKKRGDKAVFDYTKKFDKVKLSADKIKVSKQEFDQAEQKVSDEIKKAIEFAKNNIISYQNNYRRESKHFEKNGVKLGNIVRPYEKAAVYVPAGSAPLVSTVLMSVLPAKCAGVKDVIVLTPPEINSNILYACKHCGVTDVYKVGGAQAIAAAAFGTQSIPKVDKIVGPGNIYVALAKKEVFGYVDIDMVAGPSEILVLADDNADPLWAAADLMSQAEHDSMASCFLVCYSEDFADKVVEKFKDIMSKMSRKEIIEKSWKNNAKIFVVQNNKQACDIINLIAPEHLELMVDNADKLLPDIKNAGAIFIGKYTPEAIGDYIAGPSHVLPTGGSARYFSVLRVEDFYKDISLISYNKEAFAEQAKYASILAKLEGLSAHAYSVDVRG
ncbi:histidinol dehydrogenase [bacterium]|nr:histidinol dehydrogenase [bacterium]